MEQDKKVSVEALALSPGHPAGASGGVRRAEGRSSTTESEPEAGPGDQHVPRTEAQPAEVRSVANRPEAKRAEETLSKANNVRKIRIERMVSKAELARRANLSVLTIDRVERGYGCRMDTKRKILEALGLSLADRVRVFGEEE